MSYGLSGEITPEMRWSVIQTQVAPAKADTVKP